MARRRIIVSDGQIRNSRELGFADRIRREKAGTTTATSLPEAGLIVRGLIKKPKKP